MSGTSVASEKQGKSVSTPEIWVHLSLVHLSLSFNLAPNPPSLKAPYDHSQDSEQYLASLNHDRWTCAIPVTGVGFVLADSLRRCLRQEEHR